MNDAMKLMIDLLPVATVETLYMVFVSTVIAHCRYSIGVILITSQKGGIQKIFHFINYALR